MKKDSEGHALRHLRCARLYRLALATTLLSGHLAAQEPQGLAASAVADTTFRWQRDSVAGIRVYYPAGSWALRHRDSLTTKVARSLQANRALIGAGPLNGPLDVFFVESREQMRRLTRAPVTGFAHMAARAVFIVTNPEWRGFDRHEIMHVVAANAWGSIGQRNPWLQEGLAQAADGFCAGYTNEQVAYALARKDGWIPLPTLIDEFRQQSDLRAYLQAAAFLQYLMRRVDVSELRSLWQSETSPESVVAGKPLAQWETEWRGRLTGRPVVPPAALAAIDSIGCGIALPRR